MSFDQPPLPPRTPASRSIRMAELRRSVERAAPAVDQTQVLSPEQIAEIERVRAERKVDVECASRQGRSALIRQLCQAADRLVGGTPPDGTALPT